MVMSETLTYAEIHDRFDSEWVLLEDPQTDPDLTVRSGKVLCHSKDRDEVYRKMLELRPRHGAVLYTGRIPAEGTEVVL